MTAASSTLYASFPRAIRNLALLSALVALILHVKGARNSFPEFPTRPEVRHVDCARILDGDQLYAKSLPRVKLVPNNNLDMNCAAVRRRVASRSNPPTGFPIAFAKVVYQDYEFLEEQLAVNFADEHTFCFALDKKAPLAFRRNVMALSVCLPNVFLAEQEYDTDSAGHYHNHALLDCMRVSRQRQWNYIMFLQNHDIIIKSNSELADVFTALNGANDAEMVSCPHAAWDIRCEISEMNLGKLGLCPSGLSQEEQAHCAAENVQLAKGWTQVSLARATADYIDDRLNLTTFLSVLSEQRYGVDELLMQSLLATKALGIPGTYPPKCLYENDSAAPTNTLFITRLTHWSWWASYGCRSGMWRNELCVFGVEDVNHLAGVHQIMANKMLPDKDYAAISCIGEMLFNRTHHGLEDHPLDMNIYENLPAVSESPQIVSTLNSCPTTKGSSIRPQQLRQFRMPEVSDEEESRADGPTNVMYPRGNMRNRKFPLIILALILVIVILIIYSFWPIIRHARDSFYDDCGPESGPFNEEDYLTGSANQTLHQHINNVNIDSLILQLPHNETLSTYKIIILVISRASGQDERNDARSVWANSQISNMIQRNEAVVLFVVGRSEDLAIHKEAALHGDVLQVDIEESYSTTVYKMEVAFRWIEEKIQSEFIVKLDADTVADIDRLYRNLRKYQNSNRDGKDWISCWTRLKSIPFRKPGSKWIVSREDYPESLWPTFCTGHGYAMGRETFDRIVNNMKMHKVVEPEDVFFTGIVPSHFDSVTFRGADTSYEYRESFTCEKDGTPVQSMMTSHGQCINDRRQRNLAAVYQQLQWPKLCDTYVDFS